MSTMEGFDEETEVVDKKSRVIEQHADVVLVHLIAGK